MPTIAFPDVPALPGVPPLPVPPGGITLPTFDLNTTSQVATDSASVKVKPVWQINDFVSGGVILVPDSIIEFEYRGEQKIPNYPVEQGSFATYNKVAMPFDARLTCTCNGKSNMSRQEFLAAIQVLLTGLNLISIVTPDVAYGPCNLVHVDYRREARQGVSLLMAQLWFQEVRVAISNAPATATPDSATPVTVGQVAPVTPTAAQASAFSTPAATLKAITSSPTFAALAKTVPAVLGAILPFVGGPKAALQMSGYAATAGNLTQLLTSGSSVSGSSLASIPSQIGNLSGSLYAVTGGNLQAVASISAVANVGMVASDVAKVSSIAIR